MSEPLVNIRATIAKAIAGNIIAAAVGQQLEDIAARLFFKVRTYERLLSEAEAAGLDRRELDCLRNWMPKEAIDLQRDDAGRALAAVGELAASISGAPGVGFSLERTASWQKLCAEADATAAPSFPRTAGAGDETVTIA